MPFTGVHTFHRQNPAPWRWLLFGFNGALLLLLLLALASTFLGASAFGIYFFLACLIIANAVLIPLTIVKLGQRITIDFDRGTIGTQSTGALHPSDFSMLVDVFRTYPQQAHLLELRFRTGTVGVETGAFAETPRTRERDEAVLAYIWQWLPVPQTHRQLLGPGAVPGIQEYLVGKDEALAILRK